MDPVIGLSIAAIVIALCVLLSPDTPKAKPKSAKDSLDAAMQQYLKESKK